jgi:hypothetical protein
MAVRKPISIEGTDLENMRADVAPEGYVRVRIGKKGHDKIATGEHFLLKPNGERFPNFQEKDEVNLPMDMAALYEERGWVFAL